MIQGISQAFESQRTQVIVLYLLFSKKYFLRKVFCPDTYYAVVLWFQVKHGHSKLVWCSLVGKVFSYYRNQEDKVTETSPNIPTHACNVSQREERRSQMLFRPENACAIM